MSAYLHVGGESINLGNPFALLAAFADMGRAAGGRYSEFADLFGVPDATMEDGDLDPAWLADVKQQAKRFAQEFGGKLGIAANVALADLVGATASESRVREGYTGQFTDAAGHKRNYVDGKQVAADAAAPNLGPATENPPPAEHMTGGLAEKVAQADPEAAKDKGLLGKLGDAVVKVGARIYLFGLKHHDAITKGVAVLEAVFDTPQDMKEKLGYDPTMTSGTSHAGSSDSVKSSLGVSGHIVILAASHALAKAVGWLKKQLGAAEATGDLDALAEVIAGMLGIVAEEFGLAKPPDGPAVAAKLRELLTGA